MEQASINLLEVVKVLVLPAVGYVWWEVRALGRQIAKQNSRLGKIETWREDHVKLVDERHKNQRAAIQNLWDRK
jgi:hypothetical protein|tara:strand:- start:1305 stop:1526 length:222 start_codon:yes stop_codon:yes gene_type:complete